NNFLIYYVDEAGFSDFPNESAEDASWVAFFGWFDEAQSSKRAQQEMPKMAYGKVQELPYQ
ncbi:MAG: hypothetical protein ABSD42_09260, partial [Candidatus Bathyarchaeia archaeon]